MRPCQRTVAACRVDTRAELHLEGEQRSDEMIQGLKAMRLQRMPWRGLQRADAELRSSLEVVVKNRRVRLYSRPKELS